MAAKKPTQTREKVQDLVRERADLEKRMQKAATHASILFADMVGSTPFKEENEALVALGKPDTHHQTVCSLVQLKKHDGEVIKSLGDGIMVMFKGENCERRAVAAGLEVLTTLRERNKRLCSKKPDASILTRLGIHSGPIWTFTFPESNVPDPQGTTVDVAARLCALAGAQQLLCTESTFQEATKQAPDSEIFKNVGKSGRRFLKGIADPLSIRMVLPNAEDWKATHVPTSGYRRPIPENLKKQLDKAYELYLSGMSTLPNREERDERETAKQQKEREQGEHQQRQRARDLLKESYEAFARIVEDDKPGLAEARLGLAQLMLAPETRTDLKKDAACEELRRHLAAATQANPKYYKVWLLVGLARLKRFELHGGDLGNLSLAIEHTKTALTLASQDMDIHGILEAKLQLARALLARVCRANPDDGADALSEAAAICTDMKPILDGHLERSRRQHNEINMLVQVAQATNPKELDRIQESLESARQGDPQDPSIHHALFELCEKRMQLAG